MREIDDDEEEDRKENANFWLEAHSPLSLLPVVQLETSRIQNDDSLPPFDLLKSLL